MSNDRRPRVLVVAYDFPPHGAIGTMRTLRVVEALADARWEVTVLTSDPRTYRHGTAVDDALVRRVPGGVRVVRAPALRGFDALKHVVKRMAGSGGHGRAPVSAAVAGDGVPRSSKRGLARSLVDRVDAALAIPDAELAWLMPALLQGTRASLAGVPDVVYASSPAWTGQLVGAALGRALRRPVVGDFRDPWARAPWREDREPFAMRAAAALERRVVRRAERVVFVTEANRMDFAAQYPEQVAKFVVIPNGCDPREFEGPVPGPDPTGPFVLLHAGSLYAGRTPVPLLRAVASAVGSGTIDPTRFRVRFLGAVGLRGEDLTGICRHLGLGDVVEFLPRVPRQESIRAMRGASALLLLQPGHAVSVPGKLYEYMAAGRPVLAVADETSETASLVRDNGIGLAVGDDESAMVEALSCLVAGTRSFAVAPRATFDGLARARDAVALLQDVVGVA